ncbi:MAG: radical SAM family heme chaperone HemW [Lachnospiraceae bacterium]|nr:radical SAM family heme chaperone HemW [Lachnospiraceae bacterium]
MINKNAGLYLHIPFCMRKCSYCDFLSFPAGEDNREQYLKQLMKEIKERSLLLEDRCVDTVFLGGGTPSLFDGIQIGRLMETVTKYFKIEKHAEITMEMNPGTVDEGKLMAYKTSGINRISFGVQSMQEKELALLGRIHKVEEFRKNYQLARRLEFENINLDLMLALPNQTLQDVKYNLREAVALKPEHLSCYGLIIEEGTPFFQEYQQQELRRQAGEERVGDVLPGEELEREMYQWTCEFLHKEGYEQYEISNYSLKGYECRHNMKYWERGEYLGLGLGASSFLDNRRFSNVTDMKEYLSIDIGRMQEELVAEEEVIDRQAAMEEFMFLGLRKTAGISKKEFKDNFGAEYKQIYQSVHERMVHLGLLREEGDRICLTRQGIDVSNYVMSAFLL